MMKNKSKLFADEIAQSNDSPPLEAIAVVLCSNKNKKRQNFMYTEKKSDKPLGGNAKHLVGP